jgi:hypothetical protein
MVALSQSEHRLGILEGRFSTTYIERHQGPVECRIVKFQASGSLIPIAIGESRVSTTAEETFQHCYQA